MRFFDDSGVRSGALSQLGVIITFIGFGLLAFNAAAGVVMIPAGIALTFAGMHPPKRL
jgi:hypothetical protein